MVLYVKYKSRGFNFNIFFKINEQAIEATVGLLTASKREMASVRVKESSDYLGRGSERVSSVWAEPCGHINLHTSVFVCVYPP